MSDSLEKARMLVSAASRTSDRSLRALYVAEARTLVEAESARLDATRALVAAQEAELLRLAG